MNLTDRELQIITNTIINIHKEEELKAKRNRHRLRLANIKLILKNYHMFKVHTNTEARLTLEEYTNYLQLADFDGEEFIIESIIQSKKQTLAFITFIDLILAKHYEICVNSPKIEDIRAHESLIMKYIDRKTTVEIAKIQGIDVSTVCKDINRSTKALAIGLFGVSGLNFIA